MPSIFTDDEKDCIIDILEDVHDTFKKKVFVYIKKAASLSFDSNHNALYGKNANTSSGLETLTKHTILARVHYERWNPQDVLDESGLPSSENILRLKVEADDYELIKKASSIIVDEEKYSLISDAQGAGPFDVNYYLVYLRRDG